MRTEVIKADSIEAAAGRILDELKEGNNNSSRGITGGREHVIYFDGWDGLGASAVLRAVAQRLTPGALEAQGELRFDQIIHIDCSKWESRRSLQRAIAEQLDLPAQVMELFDRQDEEDDFHGIPRGSRTEIPQVLEAMYQCIQKLNHRFLVILHNGSSQEIDLSTFGFPLFGYSTNKVLWTFQGRFRLKPRMKVDKAIQTTARKTEVFLSASRDERDPQELWSFLVHQEVDEIITAGGIITQSVAAKCVSYLLRLCCMRHFFSIDYDLATHSCNYWICEGIIQQGQGTDQEDEEQAWRVADAMQHEMRLDVQYLPLFDMVIMRGETTTMPSSSSTSPPYWHLPVPAVAIPNLDMLQHYPEKQISILKLSRRTISPSSPPFLYCHGLKFLWLDHCEDLEEINTIETTGKEEDISQCFQSLWVLDVRYTRCKRILSARMLGFMTHLRELNVVGAQDWDIGQLQSQLPNIRKLRVTKSTLGCSENNLFLGMNKMELLDFSGNHTKFSGLSTSSNQLETMIITDGCVGIQKFSFKGCSKLKNLLLRGLFEGLCIIDLSATAVKILDLSAMTARSLNELFLNDCHKLCAILWPSPEVKNKSYFKKLHIDTTGSSALMKENSTDGVTAPSVMTSSSASLSVVHGARAPSEFDWCIKLKDARLLRSLVPPFKEYFTTKFVHVEIYSSAPAFSPGNDDKDVEVTFEDHPLLQPSEGDAPMLTPCPSIPSHDALSFYAHIQDQKLRCTKSLPEGEQTMTSIVIPDIICRSTYILHVHDSLSITNIPGPAPTLGSTWRYLEWCRVERCPKLEYVFTTPQLQGRDDVFVFYFLQTFWASELPKARYIWNWTPFQFKATFNGLKLLHIDLCPRLIHVLPLVPMVNQSLRYLETLEIVWCGDLREVFPLYTTDAKSKQEQQQSATTTMEFKHLKRIHLHELPKLQGICGQWRISAPKLETVKITGCWSLKRLPAVSKKPSKMVECDCEKEWWDRLHWDGLEANHHPSLYNPTHSRYYKKTLLKGSVLR
ncbi:uncharacterized protein LOC8080235 [Sorghum bicolor]|uniref:Disease resistance protein At4g27190-like leucine-rich repeats domain-containing protein n=1 Tax=Sorghum bicolor TaxID=4558 RepID=C5YB83_SORBI|nr:uncharacterized protein LOC8080235 [Sorghum bicolor]EES10327.2 hypothetical protein SORBI_3006G001400 [Sorghum bicolor]OQU81041.1 hypothetical protein SORBI_3006G001400 [Sorghum bicolor]|eukprot:XP_021318529.1 uncharacterized protein LOC8080235 [Sorghum bicolor]